MPTRAGWLTLVAAAAVALAGRAFGIIELYVVAAMAGALVVVAVLYVDTVRVRLRITRTVTPTRVHAGDATRVELSATNRSRLRTPVVALRDPVRGTRGALLHLAPLRTGQQARAAYRLPTSRRGIVPVGPLSLEVGDPFGLASRTAVGAPRQELTVYPHVDRVAMPPTGGDRNPTGVTASPNALGRQGDEFYALREYVVGDDLRRVHWPSTARADELMVRQDELPWQDRTSVVLDVRRASHSVESFERAVSAAASVAVAATRAGHVLRLISSDGTDSGGSTGVHHTNGLLEYLARVEPTGGGTLRGVLDELARSPQGGELVAVLGRGTSAELDALARLRRRFHTVVVVVTETPLPTATPLQASLSLVDATADGRFPGSWGAVVATDRAEVHA